MQNMRPGSSFYRRADLRERGWSDRDITAAVRAGTLIRPRGGVYLPSDASADVLTSCRLGGRLACISALRRVGIFVLEADSPHVHFAANTARIPVTGRAVRRHWGRLRRQPHPRSTTVEVFDALLQAVRCQPPRAAVATLDSALHTGALAEDDVDELFRALPRRFGVLRRLIDARSESGPETLVRLMLRSLGLSFDVQVKIRGVGRVDFVVEGWLIIECDSDAHHSGWEAQRRDRRRDQAAAALGYATFRPIAEDIMWHSDVVLAAIRGLVASRQGGVEKSGRSRASARRRGRSVGVSPAFSTVPAHQTSARTHA